MNKVAKLYNKEVAKLDILKRVGNMNQLADMRLMSFEEGKARGMRSIECKNGDGLEYTILPDRGMDIAWASYRGCPFSYMSKSEVSSPAYFVENKDKGFLDGFFAGILTTSGLSNVGASNTDEGKDYGMHGVISNIPASQLSIEKEWYGDEYRMCARGKVKQSRFYGEDFTLTRSIQTSLGINKIMIHDTFENTGFEDQPFMILYHVNFGYPFLSGDSCLVMNKSAIKPRTLEAEKGISTYDLLDGPSKGYKEQCFYHDFEEDMEGYVFAGLKNPNLGQNGLTAYIRYKKAELPYFCQWKQQGEQEYVMGLIPSNCYAEGRNAARSNNELTILKPGEKKEVTLELGIK